MFPLDLLKNIKLSPILKEIESLSFDAANISRVGLQALSDFEKKNKIDEKILTNISILFEDAKKPRGQTELKIVDAIEKITYFIYKTK